MLPSFCDIVPRCAVSIGQVHITHVTWSVSSSQRCRDLSVSPGHASCLLLLMTWGVSSNQKGEDPGASPDHASSLLWSSSALRSCSWSRSHYSCDLRRFVQSEMPRPRWFTWSCFLPFVVRASFCAGATRTCRAFFWDYRNLIRRGLVLVLELVVVLCLCYCSCFCFCFCCRSRLQHPTFEVRQLCGCASFIPQQMCVQLLTCYGSPSQLWHLLIVEIQGFCRPAFLYC